MRNPSTSRPGKPDPDSNAWLGLLGHGFGHGVLEDLVQCGRANFDDDLRDGQILRNEDLRLWFRLRFGFLNRTDRKLFRDYRLDSDG